VKGSGADIWGTADSFQYDSQTFTGNGTITARVVSQTNTDPWAKAGVMFRETLAAGSSFSGIVIASANPSLLEARVGTGASAVSTRGATVKPPYWVRLTRAGNLFSGSISPNGTTWTAVGTYTVPMAAQLRVGLAVTSHANGSLNTAVFDNVTITAATTPPPVAGIDVTTYKYDLARTGLNSAETVLTTANVRSTTFGFLRNLPGDGTVFAQPLYLSALSIGGVSHNVVFVATEHNSVYAYDADSGAKLWQVSVTVAGESTSDSRSCSAISPEIGITATPVINRSAGPHGAIYVVAMSRDSSGGYHQRIHALDVTTGAELFNGPTEISATYPTAAGGTTTFDPGAYEDRAGLLLLDGEIYTTWASHCDFTPYTGWIIAYSGTTLARTRVFNIGPNSNNLGPAIWHSGGAPAADSSGFIYVLAGNGIFEPALDANGFPNKQDYGNSYVKLSTAGNTLSVADYFAMWNEVDESNQDLDLGAGGPMLLPDLTDATGVVKHLAFGAGKDGIIYIVSRDSLGKFNPTKNNIWQQIDLGAIPVRSTPAYFNGRIYVSALSVGLSAYTITSARLSASPTSKSANTFGYPGTVPVVSANGTTNGIVWASTVSNPSTLYAYDATNLGTLLYSSAQAANGRDSFGQTMLFNSPIVTGGKVFVPTHTGVAVFGLR
jgi:regulation of enolase protein 1 (concanavalin A-like superfamily)